MCIGVTYVLETGQACLVPPDLDKHSNSHTLCDRRHICPLSQGSDATPTHPPPPVRTAAATRAALLLAVVGAAVCSFCTTTTSASGARRRGRPPSRTSVPRGGCSEHAAARIASHRDKIPKEKDNVCTNAQSARFVVCAPATIRHGTTFRSSSMSKVAGRVDASGTHVADRYARHGTT